MDKSPSAKTNNTPIIRCDWCGTDPIYQKYHDEEWGLPCFDEQTLFEFLILEGAQAGLSWITILKKRENFRRAYSNFNPQKMARFNEKKVLGLLQDKGIIRNELKIRSAIHNAQRYLDLCDSQSSLSDFLWQFIDGAPIRNKWKLHQQIPATTAISDTISREMKKRGFKFFGSTICYAFMQATGMVNDHLVNCHRYQQCNLKH
jgi:DNA-3-methyladenine glycosylase I